IIQALQALNWNRQETARVLDIDRTTLYKRMKKYGLLGDSSTDTGANPRIVQREQGESTSDPPNDAELPPNSANGSIPSPIAWTEPKPPDNFSCGTAALGCRRG
ncbi:MAG: helix-turn-helix domain-containing protein, partial [Planctomycetaceae bacterium]|nr:helix-turn-helix domain-containing protein [Planctomycetaceae bacterium]